MWSSVGKPGRGTNDADGGLENQARRDGARIRADYITLPIDVFDAECRIDRGLVGIGRGAGQVIEIEARKELVLVGELMVDAQAKTGWHW